MMFEAASTDPIGRATSDEAWLRAMLRAEAALASAQARAGLVPPEHAAIIEAACTRGDVPREEIAAGVTRSGNAAEPLVRWLRETVGEPAAASVHRGATSQDIVDTATMLLARDALALTVGSLDAAADRAAELAVEHRDTPMLGRTLLQPAVPITFGYKAVVWMTALDAAAAGLRRVMESGLAVQLGGAAGTLASLGEAGPEVPRIMAELLGLTHPPIAWHTDRTRVADLAGVLGTATGAVSKVARDVTLLAQPEVGEASEVSGDPHAGTSSAMPHKRNPVAAVAALGAAGAAPGLVAAVLGAMDHEHERAAGAWHAEWLPLRMLLRVTGTAAAAVDASIGHLVVEPRRMQANLESFGGLLASDAVAEALGAKMGARVARELVAELARASAASERSFADVLLDDDRVAGLLTRADVDVLLDPAAAIESAGRVVDQALSARHRSGR